MGKAILPDGTQMDYSDYIQNSPHWQKVRAARLQFDEMRCAMCHAPLPRGGETHHISYSHLGSEHIRDVITLCKSCHVIFHNNWSKQQFWKGREDGHWEVFDLEHTAKMCLKYYPLDKFISRDPNDKNLCNKDVAREIIDDYFKTEGLSQHPAIDPNDFNLFIRNKRYELYFEAETRGLSVEEFLDEYYGPKVRGKNPIRAEAGKDGGPFVHKKYSLHTIYKQNKNILLLMEAVKKLEKEIQKDEQT